MLRTTQKERWLYGYLFFLSGVIENESIYQAIRDVLTGVGH